MAIHDVVADSYSPLMSAPCCRRAHRCPSCVPTVPPCAHSLAEAQASGMHVALDGLPASGLAAARHHAPHAVTTTGPRPSPRASTTPAVTGPRRGPRTALPTLIHGPAGRSSRVGAGDRETRTDREREKRTTERIQRGETDAQTYRAGEQKKCQ